MQRPRLVFIFCLIISLASVLVRFLVFAQTPRTGLPSGSKPVNTTAAPLQTFRNLGKAYFEQGKYPEAIGQFQKVVASGNATAADHLNLGLALMQANKLDAALGEMTTAQQMDPHLLAADYNLGILYKRELRNPGRRRSAASCPRRGSPGPCRMVQFGNGVFRGQETGRVS